MFFIQKANRLSFYENRDHIIEIITKSSFDLLYNLFNIELTKLKRYLNDALTKNLILHFINSIEAFILFISKKNENLRLYINYRKFNKVIMKNRYSLFLINKILNRLNNI